LWDLAPVREAVFSVGGDSGILSDKAVSIIS